MKKIFFSLALVWVSFKVGPKIFNPIIDSVKPMLQAGASAASKVA